MKTNEISFDPGQPIFPESAVESIYRDRAKVSLLSNCRATVLALDAARRQKIKIYASTGNGDWEFSRLPDGCVLRTAPSLKLMGIYPRQNMRRCGAVRMADEPPFPGERYFSGWENMAE